MALSIKNDEADQLARQLAAITGESLTEAVLRALRERPGWQQSSAKRARAGSELVKMAAKFSKLPVRDARPRDEILGYDRDGLPS